VAKAPWTDEEGVREARTYPNACEQTPDTAFGDFDGAQVWNPNTEVSEDCLYLNVHAPRSLDNSDELLPVVVWIYGGGFMTGSAALAKYNATQYIKKDVIYVAMQYRLGSHGFLHLNGVGDELNAGFKDQIMALEWVRDNIELFGGDKDAVTLMGESAGAASVALHLTSPKSCDLFQRAILQSTGLDPWWGWASPSVSHKRSRKGKVLSGFNELSHSGPGKGGGLFGRRRGSS